MWLAVLFIAATSIEGIFGQGVIGESANNVLLINSTGLKIVRVIISDRTYEDIENRQDKLLVHVSPRKHHLEIVLRGGARIDWPSFDFRGVHEIIFDLVGNRIAAHPK